MGPFRSGLLREMGDRGDLDLEQTARSALSRSSVLRCPWCSFTIIILFQTPEAHRWEWDYGVRFCFWRVGASVANGDLQLGPFPFVSMVVHFG